MIIPCLRVHFKRAGVLFTRIPLGGKARARGLELLSNVFERSMNLCQFLLQLGFGMMMTVLFVGEVVIVLMLVRDGVRVRRAVVCVGECVDVQVCVVPFQRVDNHERRAAYHDDKG